MARLARAKPSITQSTDNDRYVEVGCDKSEYVVYAWCQAFS